MKKYLKLAIAITFFMTFATSNAQVVSTRDSIIKAYEQRSIMLQNNSYIMNGEKKRYGFIFCKIEDDLIKSPIAYAEFKKSQKNYLIALGLVLAGSGLVIGGAVSRRNNDLESKINTLFWSGTALNIGAIIFAATSTNQLHRSVWYYNRDVIRN